MVAGPQRQGDVEAPTGRVGMPPEQGARVRIDPDDLAEHHRDKLVLAIHFDADGRRGRVREVLFLPDDFAVLLVERLSVFFTQGPRDGFRARFTRRRKSRFRRTTLKA